MAVRMSLHLKMMKIGSAIVRMNAGDDAKIMWLAEDSTISILYVPESTAPPMPAIPSSIITISKIGG